MDGTLLHPVPDYDETAASLGGGAVGLAPFRIHHESCVPLHDLDKQGAPVPITLQFYGPVKPDDNTKMPVRVYRGPVDSVDWANDFTDVTDDSDVQYPTDAKQVKIVPGAGQFKPQHRYLLVPITSAPGGDETLLLCDGLLTPSDVPVFDDQYWVDVLIAISSLDMNDNQWVDEPDAALWLSDPQDFNGSGRADAADLQLLTDAFGTPVDE